MSTVYWKRSQAQPPKSEVELIVSAVVSIDDVHDGRTLHIT